MIWLNLDIYTADTQKRINYSWKGIIAVLFETEALYQDIIIVPDTVKVSCRTFQDADILALKLKSFGTVTVVKGY